MSEPWALQDAKNKFSRLVDLAIEQGPQTITRRGRETAVLVSVSDYRNLSRGKGDLLGFFRNSPLAAEELQIDRPKDFGRKVEL